MPSSSPLPDILLLLMGYPEPLRSVVAEVRAHGLVPPGCFLGDPAGRAGFPDWWDVAGSDAAAVPFLSYVRPGHLTGRGSQVAGAFRRQYGRVPTFVAFEGYDTILVLARAFQDAGSTAAAPVRDALCRIDLEGTRGRIAFSTEPTGVVHQQWKWPPVCVVAFGRAQQAFSDACLLWDAAYGNSTGRASLRGTAIGRG